MTDIEAIIAEAKKEMTQNGAVANHVAQAIIDTLYKRDEEIFSLKEQRRRDLIVWGTLESKIEALVEKVVPLMKRVRYLEAYLDRRCGIEACIEIQPSPGVFS